MKILFTILLLTSALGVNLAQTGPTLYTTHCAGCHGATLQGTTSGPALLKAVWKNNAGKEAIAHTIRSGVPGTTMIAWENTLNDRQIDELTDYISKAQSETLGQETSAARITKTTSHYPLTIEKLVTGTVKTPRGIEFVSKDSALVTEKSGTLRWLVQGTLSEPIGGLPVAYLGTSTAGLMDIALDPDYRSKGWVYLAVSTSNENRQDKNALALTRIIRGKVKANRWVEEETLFEVPDSLKVVNGNRWGCRFLFDKEGHLFFTIGDMGQAMDSQDLGKATGKVFRINADGSIPNDNPFVNQPGAQPAIYSLGNRNVQGIAQHPVTGAIWGTEHGPKGGDELNILKKGANYGWPVITYGIDYSGKKVSDLTEKEGMEQPITYWTPSIAVSAIDFCTSPLFPAWKNNLLVGALAFQELRRLVLVGNEVAEQEILFKGMGRVRDVKFGPDGALYILTNDPDAILRIIPSPTPSARRD